MSTRLQQEFDEMSEREKDRVLQRVADEIDDEAVSRICELAIGAYSNEETRS